MVQIQLTQVTNIDMQGDYNPEVLRQHQIIFEGSDFSKELAFYIMSHVASPDDHNVREIQKLWDALFPERPRTVTIADLDNDHCQSNINRMIGILHRGTKFSGTMNEIFILACAGIRYKQVIQGVDFSLIGAAPEKRIITIKDSSRIQRAASPLAFINKLPDAPDMTREFATRSGAPKDQTALQNPQRTDMIRRYIEYKLISAPDENCIFHPGIQRLSASGNKRREPYNLFEWSGRHILVCDQAACGTFLIRPEDGQSLPDISVYENMTASELMDAATWAKHGIRVQRLVSNEARDLPHKMDAALQIPVTAIPLPTPQKIEWADKGAIINEIIQAYRGREALLPVNTSKQRFTEGSLAGQTWHNMFQALNKGRVKGFPKGSTPRRILSGVTPFRPDDDEGVNTAGFGSNRPYRTAAL